MHVSDLMTTPVVTVAPETPLKEVAATLVEHRISGVPVVRAGVLAGVVSQSDLVSVEEAAEDESLRTRRAGRRRRRGERRTRTAADVMHSPVVTIAPQASAVAAAWTMTRQDVSRLAVVDRGALVGIVARSDLIRAFTRTDAELRREIVAEILPALGISANDVAVTVDAGIVRLAGSVEDDLEARCLPHAVRGVVGVVDVVAELTAQHEHRRFDSVTAAL